MFLSSLIRKRSSGKAATLLFLLFLRQMRGNRVKVAGIATIAVASTTNENRTK